MGRQDRLPGLLFQPDVITVEEEAELVGFAHKVEYHSFEIHGQAAKRTIAQFGYEHQGDVFDAEGVPPIPSELLWLRSRCAKTFDTDESRLVQALMTFYPAGAGINWHRDRPYFGEPVVGVSLLSDCHMRFRQEPQGKALCEQELPRRSGYALTGDARWHWQHSIRPLSTPRYSITFRTLRRRGEEIPAISGNPPEQMPLRPEG